MGNVLTIMCRVAPLLSRPMPEPPINLGFWSLADIEMMRRDAGFQGEADTTN